MNYSEQVKEFPDPKPGDSVVILRTGGVGNAIDSYTGCEWSFYNGKQGVVLGRSILRPSRVKVAFAFAGERRIKWFHRYQIKVITR